MLKITMLGIALAAIALAGTMSVADSKTVPPLLEQERNAIQMHDVECMDTHVLMQTPSGTPACIFTEHAFALEGRGFAFVSGSCDVFPIGSSGQSITHGIGVPGPVPIICMSRLPNVNETAIVEITYTNTMSVNVTDTEEDLTGTAYMVGWSVGSGFEVVNSGGLEYDTPQVDATNSAAARYMAFTPLNIGESITYRIEVKAVKEGYSYISSIGYLHSDTQIHLYLDDEETLHYQEHRTRYPEMHAVPERTPKATGTVVLPLERAPISDLRAVDSFGNTLDTISVDSQIQLAADLTNGQDKAQDFAYLIQIRDENGVTVSLNWINGSLSAGQSLSPATSWIPTDAGTYEVTAFVWESIENPTARSPTAMIAITVD